MRVKIFNNTEGKTFADYCQYVMSKADMSSVLCSRGVITSSADMMGSSFAFRCNTSPDVRRPDVHMVIQFREYEDRNTSKDEKTKIIRQFLSEMLWNECQYVAVMHNDVPGNAHCHLVVNLVKDDGKKANDSYSILKARHIVKRLTYNRFGKGMVTDPEKEERIRGMVMKAVRESTSMRSLRQNLAMEMIEIEIDKDGNMGFNEIGNPVSFSFQGITALETARKMHRLIEKTTTQNEVQRKKQKMAHHM